MQGSILIIANPTSNRGRGAHTADAVTALLRERGQSVATCLTQARGDAEAIASDACRSGKDRPECIVACGGDGTIQEVANALAKYRESDPHSVPALGLAPAGRCNDFARVLGVSPDPTAIAEILITGAPQPIDLGKVNDRYFCTVATAGVDAEVSSFVDSMRMPLRGTLAYLYGAVRVLARYRGRCVRLEGDFGTIEKRVFLASSANTCAYGGAIRIAPDAVVTDGLLDLCVIDSVSRLRSLFMLLAVMRTRHTHCRQVQFIKTSRVRLEADEPMELWADGERIGTTPATIEAVPDAVKVVLPAP